QMAGKNPPVKQADFRSFYTCLTASRCKGFERILIKGLAPIFDIIRSNSLYVLDFLFVQQSLNIDHTKFPHILFMKNITFPLLISFHCYRDLNQFSIFVSRSDLANTDIVSKWSDDIYDDNLRVIQKELYILKI